ncbi:Hsp20/alpha crystallin family protein [Acidisoma sp. 7E03]
MNEAFALDTLSMDVSAISSEARTQLETIQAEIDDVCDSYGPRLAALPLARNLLDFDLGVPLAMLKPRSVAADVLRIEDGYEISVELPGLDETNVEIAVSADLLTVHAERPRGQGMSTTDRQYLLSERRFGQVMRSFRVPAAADVAGMTVSCRNGVLLIHLPRKRGSR